MSTTTTSYQAAELVDTITDAMKMLSKATKGMPERDHYRAAFSRLRRSAANLALTLEEGADCFVDG